MESQLCWYGRFSDTMPKCTNLAVWQSHGLNNMMDESQWCAEHPPDPNFRRLIALSSGGTPNKETT